MCYQCDSIFFKIDNKEVGEGHDYLIYSIIEIFKKNYLGLSTSNMMDEWNKFVISSKVFLFLTKSYLDKLMQSIINKNNNIKIMIDDFFYYLF